MLAIGTSLFAIAGIAIAKGEKPFVVTLGNLRITGNGTFSPTTLPKNKLAPITLNVSGKVETLDHTHPPALKELVVEADKNGAINAKGLPVCTSGKLQAQTTEKARAACPSAIVGEGQAAVEVEFPEQKPFIAKSDILAFNGGVKGGKTTIFVHAYLTAPVSAAVVTTVKVSKVHNGRYGLKSVATVPKIAGGYGSPVSFSLRIARKFTYKGKQQSYLLAKCPDGHLLAKGTGVFSDNSRLTGSLVRACTPKG
ncbi:MAG: hypothetical protein QOF85_1236 [Solirubrobacterales bacterium]|jgi:hypothetical protein|nr:hypothetical protein [Solirubrobacterales bacterium]